MAVPVSRLDFIDWVRGVACLLMFEIHCYDAWLDAPSRDTTFFRWAQFLGGFAAPAFLLLAGVSAAIAMHRSENRGVPPPAAAMQLVRRGCGILGLGLLLRVQFWVFSLGRAPWQDLFRVDILNALGVSLILCGLASIAIAGRSPRNAALAFAALAVLVAMATPPLWTTLRPDGLPWPVESYIDGVHTFDEPQPWQFPVFPWSAFAFAGMALGVASRGGEVFRLLSGRAAAGLALSGFALAFLSDAADAYGPALYAVYDYWHTSPNFFIWRTGILLMALGGAAAWTRAVPGNGGFRPMIQFGRTSLLVYWCHLPLVYGGMTLVPHRSAPIGVATAGLVAVTSGMMLLSIGWTHLQRKRRRALA